jgi:hypothetical protein
MVYFISFIYLNIHSMKAIPMIASKHQKASFYSKWKCPIHRNSLPMASQEKSKENEHGLADSEL